MTPTPEDHEAAARIVETWLETGDGGFGYGELRALIAAALAEAVRVARQEVWDYVEKSNPATIREAVRVARQEEREACALLAGEEERAFVASANRMDAARRWRQGTMEINAALACRRVEEAIRARSEAQATPAPEEEVTIFSGAAQVRAAVRANKRGTPPETKERG